MPEQNEQTTPQTSTDQTPVTTEPVKRGRKPSKRRTGYFYEEQEEAFVRYVQSEDQRERNQLFRDILYPAFTKMIESIIRRYNLFTPTEDFEDTFHDTMSFMITKVNNYDVSRGKKVYSYCGTVCKNYLLYKRTQYARQQKRMAPYDPLLTWDDNHVEDMRDKESIELNSEIINKMISELRAILSNADSNLSENEDKIANSLLFLLENWEDLFVHSESRKFTKTCVLYFLKETTRLTTTEIRDAMKRFKALYGMERKKAIEL